MADLMSGTWEYEKLEKTYNNFMVPAVKFEVGGADLIKKGLRISSVEAVLSIKGCSSVSIIFTDCYDMKNGTFDKNLKSAAVLGKPVVLSMGYGSAFQKIFKGYLSHIRTTASSGDGMRMEFVGLDARRLMMTDNNHIKEYKIKNYSDAVSELLKRYSKLATPAVDATSENMKDGLIWQNGSDYDFITKELIESGRVQREFFIAVDKAYFRKPRSVAAPVLTLKPGGGLVSFESDAGYMDESYHILGYDTATGKPIEGKADAKTKWSSSSPLSQKGEWYISDPACTAKTQATNRAKALADRALAASQQAHISCIGIPELIPGRYIKIDRVDSLVNKKYYITQAVHRYDENGYVTELTTEGWE